MNRLLYSCGLSKVSNARLAVMPSGSNVDVSDILDPTDSVYNSTLKNIALTYQRLDGQPVSTNQPVAQANQAEVVQGVRITIN